MNAAMSSYSAAFGRLLIAVIFLLSGVGKIFDPAGTLGYIDSVGLPAPWAAYVVAIAVEVGGGLLLVLGYQTRVVAGALAVFTIVTALAFHSALSDQDQLIHFLKNLAIAGGLLQVVALGAGAFSIDALGGASAQRSIGPVARSET